MELVTPQALADLLTRDKEILLSAWEQRAKQIPGTDQLPSDYLRDHLPHLIDELTGKLRQPHGAGNSGRGPSAAHGQHRQQVGLPLEQVVEEYKILRQCILEHTEARDLAVAGDARRLVNDTIDEGIKTALESYIGQRDAAEKQRREEYLAFIVHDLRSPLSAIYYAILLAERELEDAQASERVRSIHAAIKRNIERMRALIAKLLQEERNLKTPPQVAVERENVDLWPVVESAVRSLGSLAASSQTGIVNRVPRDLRIQADGEHLERIFQNLLSNAIEYTFKGQVTVDAARTAGGGIECRVSDNGSGIPEELRDKVFDKYVSDPKRRGGMGLGLAVVKQLVEAHSGTIDVRSEVGKGTVIRFSIPSA